ncbi:MAG TPA: RyR domain-containing protein [Mycobacteriales bacterium]|nr:RyR domain-containing protein [Mycobacteriales bacterium]
MGDVTLDWLVARMSQPSKRNVWTELSSAFLSGHPGGAALLADLLEEMSRALVHSGGPNVRVLATRPPASVRPGDPHFHHTYAICSHGGGHDGAWRVEEFLGVMRARAAVRPAQTVPEEADLLVVDDGNLGARQLLSGAEGSLDARWVLASMAAPVAKGPLWDRLTDVADRLVIVTTVDDLRASEVEVSRELSWERTAQDLVSELLHDPAVNDLSRAAHLVVSFDSAGALLLSTNRSGPVATLVFDPVAVEGSRGRESAGGMVGYTSCLVAGLARALLVDPREPDLVSGIRRGLGGMRALQAGGYDATVVRGLRTLRFPLRRVVTAMQTEPSTHAVAPVPLLSAPEDKESWTILRDRHTGGLDSLARRIVLNGPEHALTGVPIGRFGKLLTVDRREIEGYGSLRTLIREYAGQAHPKRPLSIAVFGPPGAGKSFGVSEVARAVLPERIRCLTFNCSQLGGPGDLIAALHQVRDAVLQGALPLVFWDEFDSSLDGKALGWLRFFLAPMQDGAFQEGQVEHPIGPAIFVFAGGTSDRMSAFAAQTSEAFRLAKGPDFVSRLKGYVDVLGPNPAGPDLDSDPYCLIRRAILVRSVLSRDVRGIFHSQDGMDVVDIDPGVLRGFLLVNRFRHGARSIESIVTMSLLGGKSRYERSCLPSDAQLELHVDAAEFRALVHRFDLGRELSDRLAEAAHVVWCGRMLSAGFAWGEATDDYLRAHPSLAAYAGRPHMGPAHPALVAFAALPENVREENRAVVRDIPNKLAAAGYVMRPSHGPVVERLLPDDEIEQLAQGEHERWMRRRLDNGWRYGCPRDDKERRHPSIVPWHKLSDDERRGNFGAFADAVGDEELSEAEKEKDRDVVRAIPHILAVAGYTIDSLSPDRPALRRPDRTGSAVPRPARDRQT